jgi:hypothetical protein
MAKRLQLYLNLVKKIIHSKYDLSIFLRSLGSLQQERIRLISLFSANAELTTLKKSSTIMDNRLILKEMSFKEYVNILMKMFLAKTNVKDILNQVIQS